MAGVFARHRIGVEAFRRGIDQSAGGRGVRYLRRQYVRLLGLGRRALLAMGSGRTDGDREPGAATVRRTAAWCTCDGHALPAHTVRAQPAGPDGAARRVVIVRAHVCTPVTYPPLVCRLVFL